MYAPLLQYCGRVCRGTFIESDMLSTLTPITCAVGKSDRELLRSCGAWSDPQATLKGSITSKRKVNPNLTSEATALMSGTI
jgi:hypothetical protein